jgi:hypothetical protein
MAERYQYLNNLPQKFNCQRRHVKIQARSDRKIERELPFTIADSDSLHGECDITAMAPEAQRSAPIILKTKFNIINSIVFMDPT